jgi:type IV secretory pathway ATPase VirB11/archaellum biosynthesis ATPase
MHRIMRREEVTLRQTLERARAESIKKYIEVLQRIIGMLEQTRLVTIAKPYLPGYKTGDRSVYRRIFNPTIKPDFMFTKLMATYPPEAEELDSYMVGNTEVTMFSVPDTIQTIYHMIPPEFKLDEDEYQILDGARRVLAEHKPKRSEFIDPHRMREVFTNIGSDLIDEMGGYMGIKIRKKKLSELTEILVRYSVGFGLIEVLLSDEKVQDVTINSPMGQIPMFVIHQDFDECRTNIIPTVTEAESWASKMRMISGRPLDEANPILDTELELPGARTRIGVIAPPLNPFGLGFAFRRHRDKPWTLPLFIKTGMINPLAAGLMSFLVDGNRTMLVAGTRSAGKSSLLGSLLVEIMRKYRIITIEDTLELPSESLRKMGYNIQPMKVASAMAKGGAEVAADVGIRTTLRLGDSALIVGEVRSTEARALYEAMRVGALANVVAGTIHGDSPYGVFDRVVNDLEVPRTSFKATDLVIVANPIRSPDGLHRWRRVTQITEIRKFWDEDPLKENGFGDLMKYIPDNDELEPTDDLINGESDILKSIAGNVKEWAGDWDAVWDNITLRMNIKKAIAEIAGKADQNLLEAPFVIQCNDQFHRISNNVREEVGSLDSKRIYAQWESWLKREIKKQATRSP